MICSCCPRCPGVHDRLRDRHAAPAARAARRRPRRVVAARRSRCSCCRPPDRRGKRRAWGSRSLLFAAAAVAHLLKGPDPIAVARRLAMRARRCSGSAPAFRADADPRSLLEAVALRRRLPARASSLFGFVSLFVERDHVTPDLTLGGIVETTFKGLVGLDGPYTYERDLFERLLRRRAARARHPRRRDLLCLVFRPFVAAAAADAERRRARASSSAPGATTRSPTSRCATTRATSSPRDGAGR